MKPAQVSEGGAGEKVETVMLRVAVEVGVETGGERDAQRVGGGKRGPAQGTLGGDMHDIGAINAPRPQQGAAHRQPEPEHGIAGDGQTRVEHLVKRSADMRRVGLILPRAVDDHAEPALGETGGEVAQGHGDAVDLWRESFGDEREFQLAVGIRREWLGRQTKNGRMRRDRPFLTCL